MKLATSGIENGKFLDKYGKRGEDTEHGIPKRSFPIEIQDPPEGTKSFALIFQDIDAAPVSGFIYTHWIAANIKKEVLEEDSSRKDKDYIQGTNSWYGSEGKEASQGYGGMAPPNEPHRYDLYVFALDKELDLEEGFFINELIKAMEGHILEVAELSGMYDN